MRRVHLLSLVAIFSLAALMAGCWGSSKDVASEDPVSSPGVTGNLVSEIRSVTFSSGKPVVTFTLFDQDGNTLVPTTSGLTARFYIARLTTDGYYENYFESTRTPGTPGYDSAGTYENLGSGLFRYTFSKSIDNASLTFLGIIRGSNDNTHTVAAQIYRTITTSTGKSFQQAANPYHNFRPSGAAVVATREVVAISNCNECHLKLGLHGGSRRDVALCILCHYPGVTESEGNRNTVDFKSMIHRIHMGKNLDSNLKGGEYSIGGTSYKSIGYPFWSQDSLITKTPIDCVKCHKAGTDTAGRTYGVDAAKYKTAPTYNKCITCHDTLVYLSSSDNLAHIDNNGVPATVAARNHALTYGAGDIDVEGANADNSAKCIGCHGDSSTTDYYVRSITGAHTILEESSIYTGVNFQIISVDNAIAGRRPVVLFKITQDNGTAINPLASTSSFSLKMGVMPTGVDYLNASMNAEAQPFSKTIKTAPAAVDAGFGDNSYVITFDNAVPAGATGIGVIGLEGRKTFSLPASARRGNPASTKNVGGLSVQYYFNVTTGAPVTSAASQRRISVDLAKCNVCHYRLSFHGGNRTAVQQCVICHVPGAAYGDAFSSFNFKDMIHIAHTGELLDNTLADEYYEGRFAEMRYPQDRRNCLGCHVATTSYGVPLPTGVLPTTIDNLGTLRRPIGAACLSCHEDEATVEFSVPHVANQTSGSTELCGSCHTSGLSFGVDYAHEPVR